MNRNSDVHQHSWRPDLLGTRRSAGSQQILGRLERNAGQRSRQLAVVTTGTFAAALLLGSLVWLAWSNGSASKPGNDGGQRDGVAVVSAGEAGVSRWGDGTDGAAARVSGADAATGTGGARVVNGAAGDNGGARLLRETPAAGSSQFETALSIAQVAAGVKASTQAAPPNGTRGPVPPQTAAPALARSGGPGTASGAGASTPAASTTGAQAGRAPESDRLAVASGAKPAAAGERSRGTGSGAFSSNADKVRAAARARAGLAAQAARQRAAQSAKASDASSSNEADPDVALISAIRQASRPAGN